MPICRAQGVGPWVYISQDMDTHPDSRLPAAVALSYLGSFATGDPETIASHVGEDFINDHASALGSPSRGRQEYLRRLPAFLASLPGLHYDADQPIVDGPRVAAPYTLHASGLSKDQHVVPITIRGVMLMRIENGLITKRLDVWDALTYLRQVGEA